MPLVPYTPDAFDSLRVAASRLRVKSLAHRPFVDYYYAHNPWCDLCLLQDEDGSVSGTIGVDRMTFAAGERSFTLGFGSNYHTARSGSGGYLFLHWMKAAPFGLVFGGSEHTHRILRGQRWTYFPGVRTYVLNEAPSESPGEPAWRRWAKRFVAGLRRVDLASLERRIPREVRARVSVHEAKRFTEDMLPHSSPFSFRFAPGLDYLRWRYHTGLSFVRYRLFRIETAGRTSGYVVLNESPGRLLVAQCDGEEARTLAWGVLLSLAQATERDTRYREVLLTCSHAEMRQTYQRAGFRPRGAERPSAIGSRRGPVDLPRDSSRWLINLDWGDNGLRAPFLDQSPDNLRPLSEEYVGGSTARN
jgi:hypothetical protein